MKVGIFLGYGPETELGKEGLGRYLANLVKNLNDSGNQIEIACSRWLLNSVEKLLDDFKIDYGAISFIVEKRIPIIWRVFDWRRHRRKRSKRKILQLSIKAIIDFCIDNLIDISSFAVAFILAILIGILCLICVPIVLIGFVLYCLFLGIKSLFKLNKKSVKGVFHQIVDMYEELNNYGIRLYSVVYNKVLENVQKRIVKKINRKAKNVDVWYSPAVFWPVFNEIEGTKVVNVPDLVTNVFASKWGDNKNALYSLKKCIKTIESGTYFITYSNYVREKVLIDMFGVNPNHIEAIPHAINKLDKNVRLSNDILCNTNLQEEFTMAYCNNILSALKGHVRGIDSYILGFDFKDIQYVFYPSQVRPHKNILNLVKAYEILLRRYHIQLKLFLTCDLDYDKEIKAYIEEKRLQYDIISFYNVDAKGLAALYSRATLVINPTLYEGGFPFTFGEGMSVGTPSVMSNIPQVKELMKDYCVDEMLFDPYDIDSIVNSVEYALNNLDELYEKEKKFYDFFDNEYNQEKVGNMYVKAFEKFIALNNDNHINV